MRAAVKSFKITPEIGIPFGGNVREDNISRGVHDDLFCNVVLLEENNERVCFLSFDLLGLDYETCQSMKSKIAKAGGLEPDKIMITATHTHSGPDVLEIFKPERLEEGTKYLKEITEVLCSGVSKLVLDLKPARLEVSKGTIDDLSFNRRLFMKKGPMKMNWEDIDMDNFSKEAGPIDTELYVITVSDANGKIIGLMVNFTLHPAILVGKDWLISRDYINYLDNYIKDNLEKDAVVFFANGAEGNINHLNFRDKNQARGFEEAERIGNSIGKHVVEAVKSKENLDTSNLKCLTKSILLPLRKISEEEVLKAENLLRERGDEIPSLLDGVPDEVYAREIIKLSKIEEKFIRTEIQAVRVGSSVIVTLPGEVFVEFGLKIKELSKFKNTLVFGLTNDFIGYIPTCVAFREGGYEIKTASSSKLDKMAGDMLVTEIVELLQSI